MKKRSCNSRYAFLKSKLFLSLLILGTMLFVVSGCSSTASAPGDDSIELRLAHFFPSTHPAEMDLVKPWAKAIEEETKGKVRITSYPNETLLQANAIYDGVVNGIADIGLSCFSYTRGSFPVLEVFELPGITYNNSKVASKVAWEGIKELNPEEVQDTKLMMVFTTGSGDLYTKDPVRTLEDLKGKKIRATGLSAKTLKALGAAPEGMPQSEAYEALAKGVVQGNLGPIEVLKGWKQAEVTKNLTLTPFLYNTLFFVTMNLDKWNSLEPDLQKAIEKVNEKFFDEVAMDLWDKQNEEALKWAQDEMGVGVFTLSETEKERWINLVKPIQDEYVKNMNQKGLPGQSFLDTAKKLAEKYNREYQ